MIKKIFSFLTVICIFLTLTTNIVSANHYRWLVEDPNTQRFEATNGENYISAWVYYGYWNEYGFPTGFPLVNEVNTAAANWNTAIPQVAFENRDNTTPNDIDFSMVATPCGVGIASGCFNLTSVARDDNQAGNYTVNGTIELENGLSGPRATQVIAHELGHYLGFHEGYIDNDPNRIGSCSGAFPSIMDTCEGFQGPTQTDVNDFINKMGGRQGKAETVSASWNSYDYLELKWLDVALAESEYLVEYFRVTPSGLTPLDFNYVTKNIGLIRGMTTLPGRDYSDMILMEDNFSKVTAGYQSGTYRAKISPINLMIGNSHGIPVTIDFTI